MGSKSPRAAKRRSDAMEAADGSATAAQRALIQKLDPKMPTAGLTAQAASEIITWLKELK